MKKAMGADALQVRAVVGIVTDPERKRVVLLKALKPPVLKGLLNGPGGKCGYDESFSAAMARECLEEIGIDIPADEWRRLFGQTFLNEQASLDWDVTFFHAETDLAQLAQTVSDAGQPITVVNIEYVLDGTYLCAPLVKDALRMIVKEF